MRDGLRLAGLGLLLLVVRPVQANDASFHGHGAMVVAVRTPGIQMESEDIRIRYDPAAPWQSRWVADCTFTFVSHRTETVALEMGFPDAEAFPPDREKPWSISEFSVTVDGRPVAATHRGVAWFEEDADAPNDDDPAAGAPAPTKAGDPSAAVGPAAAPGPPAPTKTGDPSAAAGPAIPLDSRFSAAYVWPVSFAPKARVVVKNRYRFGGFGSMLPYAACTSGATSATLLDDVFWRRAYEPERGLEVECPSICSAVEYVVTAAGTWDGPIGRADIAIELPPDVWPHLFVPWPAADAVSDGFVRWHFENWQPQSEIRLVLLFLPPDDDAARPPLLRTVAEARAFGRFALLNGFEPALVQRLAAAYAGRTGATADPALRPLLAEAGVTLRPDARPAKLSATERAIVRVLHEFAARLAAARDPARAPIRFRARLGPGDVVDGRGRPLASLAAAVRRDRENVAGGGPRDPDDEPAPAFADAAGRARLTALLVPEDPAPAMTPALLATHPLVEVFVWSDYATLRLLPEPAPVATSPAAAVSEPAVAGAADDEAAPAPPAPPLTLGPLTLGQSPEAVLALLGKPARTEWQGVADPDPAERLLVWHYPAHGAVLTFQASGTVAAAPPVLARVRVRAPNTWRTAAGLGVGSTRDDVRARHGRQVEGEQCDVMGAEIDLDSGWLRLDYAPLPPLFGRWRIESLEISAALH